MRLAGLDSFGAVARHVTSVGRGEERALTPIPPELTFPPNYTISAQACYKALNRALDREPRLSIEKLRKVNLQRCERFLLALQASIRDGDAKAIVAAVRVLEHQASISGLKTQPSPNTTAEPEVPEEKSAPPNEAIVSLFQSAMETLIACGARPRNYPELVDERGFIDITPTALDRDEEDNRKNDELEAKQFSGK
jgi:hypothetical protein